MVRQKTVLHFLHTIMAQLYLGHGIVHGIWHEIGHLAVAQPTRLQLGARRGKKLRRQPVSPTRRNQKACVQNLTLTMNVWLFDHHKMFPSFVLSKAMFCLCELDHVQKMASEKHVALRNVDFCQLLSIYIYFGPSLLSTADIIDCLKVVLSLELFEYCSVHHTPRKALFVRSSRFLHHLTRTLTCGHVR